MNRFFNHLLVTFFVIVLISCSDNFKIRKSTDSNGYSYEYAKNDPMKTRIYTLKNGLKIFISVNKDEPRFQSFIAVKAGSTYDPADNTGLAHYLEHLMFKGTSRIGSLDWEKEKILLQQISDLYELHKATSNTDEKKKIYARIDSISQIASQYVVPNEYDNLCQILGAKYTNAYTTNERTVYMNDIPSNELEKWLMLEKERFSELVLRLFHTELETVYEEFNMGQDDDNDKLYEAFSDAMFPKHPYGQQTTIGKAEHLKNPSMVNIHNYWSTYYVPNNMAICLSGDLDYESTVKLIDKYFGQLASKPVPEKHLPVEEPITEPKIREVFGPDAEDFMMGWRIKGDNTYDKQVATLISALLSNGKAGLIDLDLNQEQKVLESGAFTHFYKEYGLMGLYGRPKTGQTLEEVKDLLMNEMEKIKKGEFEDWLIPAVINDLKLNTIRNRESNFRAHEFVYAFTNEVPWNDYLDFYNRLEKISKNEVMAFANENFKSNNFVAAFKRTGKDDKVVKVEKPKITPVTLNRNAKSEFQKEFENIKSERIQPVFIDFDKQITSTTLSDGVDFHYITNPSNELFDLEYIIDMGSFTDKMLPVAMNYLPYMGTNKFSPSELKQEFFKLGISFDVYTGNYRSYISLSGLESNIEKGIDLLEHIISEAKADSTTFAEYIKGIQKERENNKLNKNLILRQAMHYYSLYGPKNPFTNVPTNEELTSANPDSLNQMIKNLFGYKHQILYYGQNSQKQAFKLIKNKHHVKTNLKDVVKPLHYEEIQYTEPVVYIVDYDMVQANILLVASDTRFDSTLIPYAMMYNEFYSNLVYQDIREARGLAYTAFTSFSVPERPDLKHRLTSFVGTQTDKLKITIEAISNLLNNIPQADDQFESARISILKSIENERIIKDNIFWTYIRNKDRGINYDIRKSTYQKIQQTNIDEFRMFFDQHIKGKNYNYLILSNQKMLDNKVLNKLGKITYLTKEQIFNY